MKRSISLVLSASLLAVMLPRQVEAHEPVASASHDHNPEAASTTLMYAGTVELSNGWIQTYSVYADDETGDVWGDGYVHDPRALTRRAQPGGGYPTLTITASSTSSARTTASECGRPSGPTT